jgi:hypothetical protein
MDAPTVSREVLEKEAGEPIPRSLGGLDGGIPQLPCLVYAPIALVDSCLCLSLDDGSGWHPLGEPGARQANAARS